MFTEKMKNDIKKIMKRKANILINNYLISTSLENHMHEKKELAIERKKKFVGLSPKFP